MEDEPPGGLPRGRGDDTLSTCITNHLVLFGWPERFAVWVQLRTVKNIEVAGRRVTHRPGDWVEVGKHLALRWISLGEAWVPKGAVDVGEFMDTTDVGVLCIPLAGVDEDAARSSISPYAKQLSVRFEKTASLPWTRTLLWDGKTEIRGELLPVGFHLLDTWEVACPLLSYETLALNLGEKEDKARTKALIHDLRVPLYEPGLLFVRRTQDTEYLMDCWVEERVESTSYYHAFLRAVYRSKPLILPLPTTWLSRANVMGGERGE